MTSVFDGAGGGGSIHRFGEAEPVEDAPHIQRAKAWQKERDQIDRDRAAALAALRKQYEAAKIELDGEYDCLQRDAAARAGLRPF